MDDYSTLYRSDTNSNDGGINLFVREDIPFNLLVNENKSVESMYIERILHRKKWIILQS